MGTTFVSVNATESMAKDEVGFWMRDSILELWLRLLALHVPEPTTDPEVAYRIRNQWLLASKGFFGGCVPHDLPEAVSTAEGRAVVDAAIDSLMSVLATAPDVLDGSTLELLGMEGGVADVETRRLIDVGNAFRDLLAGKLSCTVSSTTFMPGSR